MPSSYLVEASVQPAFYNLAAVTKTLLKCFNYVRPSRRRDPEEDSQLEQINLDIAIAVEDVMRITRQNFENDDYFRQWCLEKDEDWSTVALEFTLLDQTLCISSLTEKCTKWYDDFNNLHAEQCPVPTST